MAFPRLALPGATAARGCKGLSTVAPRGFPAVPAGVRGQALTPILCCCCALPRGPGGVWAGACPSSLRHAHRRKRPPPAH